MKECHHYLTKVLGYHSIALLWSTLSAIVQLLRHKQGFYLGIHVYVWGEAQMRGK